MKPLPLALFFFVSCASTGGGFDAPQVRRELALLRDDVEPILEELVAASDDPDLRTRFERAKVVADAIGIAFDAYLAEPSDANRMGLVAALEGGLVAADALVNVFVDDEDRALRVRIVIRLLQIAVRRTARALGEVEIEERASEALALEP